MKYIVRFREENSIKELELGNQETLKYIMEELEKKNIMYVVIKEQKLTDKTKWEISCLLDYLK